MKKSKVAQAGAIFTRNLAGGEIGANYSGSEGFMGGQQKHNHLYNTLTDYPY